MDVPEERRCCVHQMWVVDVVRPDQDDLLVPAIQLLSTHSLVQFPEGGSQLAYQLIQLGMLLRNLFAVPVVLTFIDGLPCHVADDIFTLGNVFTDFLGEVSSAQRALRLDFKPFLATPRMEVVLRVALERQDLIIWIKCDETNRAVWHVFSLLSVF